MPRGKLITRRITLDELGDGFPHAANLSLVTVATMHLPAAIGNAGDYLALSLEGPGYYPWQQGFPRYSRSHTTHAGLKVRPIVGQIGVSGLAACGHGYKRHAGHARCQARQYLRTGAGAVATGADRPRPDHRRYGRLGLQLALLLVFVAVGAIAVANVVAAETVFAEAQDVLHHQEADEAMASAQGAAVTFTPVNWSRALEPVFAIAQGSGTRLIVRDAAGRVVRSSPGYRTFPSGPRLTEPVRVRGRLVGSITMKFDDHGIGALIGHFVAQRWRARLISAGFGVLFALVVAFFVAPMIAAPIDRLLMTARARGAGRPQSRVGKVRGLGDLRELAATFDQMADTLGRQDQVRRELVANVAHELRTPIAVLQASTEAMVDGFTPLTIDSVRSLHDEAVRLGRMTDDLQRLAEAEAAALELRVEPCNLAEVAQEAASSLAGIFDGAGVRLTKHLRAVWVMCDPDRMREVVTNLLTNAAKFTPAGGAAVLETSRTPEAAVLTVSDTGVGIPADELPRLPERFYRGRESDRVSGTGIGLAIVAELVRAHQATMDISSVPGEGTAVTIRLPLAAQPASPRLII